MPIEKSSALAAALACMEAASPTSTAAGLGMRVALRNPLKDAKKVIEGMLVDALIEEVEDEIRANYQRMIALANETVGEVRP